MKKILCLMLAAVTAFMLVGWSGSSADFPAISEQLTQNMLDGDFDPVTGRGDDTFKQAISPEVLRAQWEQVTDGIGEYGGVIDSTVHSAGGYTAVEQLNSFPNINLKITYSFNDASGELTGLWISFAAKPIEPQSSDAFEETPVQIGEDETLDGMLTLPKNTSDCPAVVLVHGSGANDMDETIGTAGNKPLADIAHGLAERSIASIRYNKRTNQYPASVSAADLTIEYEVIDDAVAAYGLLNATDGVDASRVFIVGHSLGGMLAPKIAELTGAAGYVSLAGSPRHLADIVYDQNAAVVEAADVTATEKQFALAQVKLLGEDAKAAHTGDTGTILGYAAGYWASINELDLPGVIQSLAVPVLIAQGSDDFQVYADVDYPAWQEVLSGNGDAVFRLYDGLNHLFMRSNGKTDTTEYNPPGNVGQDVIDDIAAFINT